MNTLTEICAAKRADIARRKSDVPQSLLIKQMAQAEPPRGFKAALQNKISQGGVGLIAEIKKASPSAGVIRADFNPAALARAYEAGGAACLSVLTDTAYFQGSDEHLKEASGATPLPVLRKDFILDPYQIFESRALGADCILIIMAALTDAEASILDDMARDLGMDVLVEVHDKAELERALLLSPSLVGVNNRNLKTLKTDLAVSESLAKEIPANILAVCESGIRDAGDAGRMRKAGFSCFLVGESLMRETDVARATKALLGAA